MAEDEDSILDDSNDGSIAGVSDCFEDALG